MSVTIKNAQIKNAHIGPTVATRGLVACWNVVSTHSYPRTGSKLYDLIKNKNNGDMVNMNSSNFSDDVGGSLILDGTNEYINIPYHASNLSLDVGTGSFSISMWVAPSEFAVGTVSEVARQKSSSSFGVGASAGWSIGINSHGVFGWGLADMGLQDETESFTMCSNCTPSLNVPWDEWHHITMSYDVISKNCFAYIDAIQHVSLVAPSSFGSLSNTRPLEIGGRVDYGQIYNPFKGSISSLYFYKSALNTEEIEKNYNATKSNYQVNDW